MDIIVTVKPCARGYQRTLLLRFRTKKLRLLYFSVFYSRFPFSTPAFRQRTPLHPPSIGSGLIWFYCAWGTTPSLCAPGHFFKISFLAAYNFRRGHYSAYFSLAERRTGCRPYSPPCVPFLTSSLFHATFLLASTLPPKTRLQLSIDAKITTGYS